MRQLQAAIEPDPVEDYRFVTTAGEVALSELFGDKPDLFVIHNMGIGCNGCTLWADGFNGVLQHLENRAAFVVSTPNDPATQDAFKAERGWRFRMVSHQGTSFAQDMGYRKADGGWQPGVSVFRRIDGQIFRVSDAGFEPGDDFCTAWHLFDMLAEGSAGWMPKRQYQGEAA
jgi:predicted dithiol-disulfide oxidoreductase (DUF899 family)